MAVAFSVPDDGGSGEPINPNIPASGASSAMQSPLLTPVSPDLLMQAFYEALYRCSQGSKYFFSFFFSNLNFQG